MKDKCVIWGTGSKQRVMAKEISYRYDIVAYCDSNKIKQRKRMDDNGLIISPEELGQLCRKEKINYVIVCATNENSIKQIKEKINKEFPEQTNVLYWKDIADKIENKYLEEVRKNMVYSWKIDFIEQAEIWVKNFMSEVNFWVQYVANPKGEWHEGYYKRLRNADFLGIDKTSELLVQNMENDAIIMDIGCGLYSMYGERLPNSKKIKLLPVDPLAAFYNHMNQKFAWGGEEREEKIKYCQFGMFEFMANFYEENYCDVIIINNALDHCIDPYKSIIECIYILKKGGKMRLNHRRSEAIFEKYAGLHKWNIDYDAQDNLIFWNDKNAINVSESLKSIADIKVTHTDDYMTRIDQKVIVDITKVDNFKLEQFFDMEKERYYLAFLIKNIMQWIADNNRDYLMLW